MMKTVKDNSESDRNNENANRTVSTPANLSQATCENAVVLKSNLNTKQVEVNVNSQSFENNGDTLDSDKVSNENEGQNGSSVGGVVSEETKSKSAENVKEIEEEDVPGDFFDDFFKEDFMDGLDIVDDDAWEEDKVKEENDKQAVIVSVSKSVETKKKKKQKSSSKNSHDKKSRASPAGEKKPKQKKRKQEEKQSEHKRKKSKEKVIDADEFDIRRDPKKTRRDIERDKARCEKDKEKKIISEKLNLVETGLVPPGMEMEIDLEEIKKQKEKIVQNKPPRDLREHLKSLRSDSKSPRKQRSPKRKSLGRRSASPIRRSSPKRRKSRTPNKGRSPLKTTSQKKSPVRRASPRRSPIRNVLHRSHERSPRRSRSVSPYYRSRRLRYSPLRDRLRERSASRESDRERWLRRRRRSRSRSQRRKRDEKKSFLQEIAEKLNETRPQPVNLIPPLQQPMHFVLSQPLQTVSAPVPTPVPPPSIPTYFPPQPQPQSQPQYDPYDQNFFIGTPQPVAAPSFNGQPQAMPLPSVDLTQTKVPLKSVSSVMQPVALPVSPASLGNNVVPRNAGNAMPGKTTVEARGEIEKLFQDKKITLSEFLAITAKPEVASSSPAHLQEKIKVISRCQEAIKILGSSEKKYTGKLVVHRTDDYKLLEEQNRSPLKKMPSLVFPFTQPQTKRDHKTTFTSFINQLLQKIGMMKEVVVDVDTDTSSKPGISPISRNLSPPPPPLITPIKNAVQKDVKRNNFANLLAPNQLSKMVQTNLFKCATCEKRNKILYKESSVQCGGDKTSYSVSTQVTERDFHSKIPVTQSLASLTPAQLLAKSRASINSDDFDIVTKSNYANRPNFSRAADSYNLPMYGSPSPPLHYNLAARDEVLPPSMFNILNANLLRSQVIGGGGRGRAAQPNSTRTLDPSNRFDYNSYY